MYTRCLRTLCTIYRAACIGEVGRSAALQILAITSVIAKICVWQPIPNRSARFPLRLCAGSLSRPVPARQRYRVAGEYANLAIAVFALAMALTLSGGSRAEEASVQTYTPAVGQAGKDVVWVPTPQALVDEMLNLAKVKPGEYLIDLGSGDGRTVISAAQRGLTALGIEYNPDMVQLARRNARQAGVESSARFYVGDLFEADFSKADIITMFLLPTINERLKPGLLKLRPGTRIVSNSFTMGDWESDGRSVVTDNCQSYCTALLWIVPAQVAGDWKLGDQTLHLTQQYQVLDGSLGEFPLSEARMNGDVISFVANGVRYVGTFRNGEMSGRTEGGRSHVWSASKL